MFDFSVAPSNTSTVLFLFLLGLGVIMSDLSEQNNGKACILRETIRLLKDLVGQIDSLKKDSASLLSETHYVSSSQAFSSLFTL